MKKTDQLTKQLWIALGLLFVTSIGLGFVWKTDSEVESLKLRAHRIFEFDHQNPNRLANKDVVGLSMDLGFGNYSHAKELIAKLEKQF